MKKIITLLFLGVWVNQFFAMDVSQKQAMEMKQVDYDWFFKQLSEPLQEFVNEDFKVKWSKEERADLVVDFTWIVPMESFKDNIGRRKDHEIYDTYKPFGVVYFLGSHVDKDPNQVLYLAMVLDYIRLQEGTKPDTSMPPDIKKGFDLLMEKQDQ